MSDDNDLPPLLDAPYVFGGVELKAQISELEAAVDCAHANGQHWLQQIAELQSQLKLCHDFVRPLLGDVNAQTSASSPPATSEVSLKAENL